MDQYCSIHICLGRIRRGGFASLWNRGLGQRAREERFSMQRAMIVKLMAKACCCCWWRWWRWYWRGWGWWWWWRWWRWRWRWWRYADDNCSFLQHWLYAGCLWSDFGEKRFEPWQPSHGDDPRILFQACCRPMSESFLCVKVLSNAALGKVLAADLLIVKHGLEGMNPVFAICALLLIDL